MTVPDNEGFIFSFDGIELKGISYPVNTESRLAAEIVVDNPQGLNFRHFAHINPGPHFLVIVGRKYLGYWGYAEHYQEYSGRKDFNAEAGHFYNLHLEINKISSLFPDYNIQIRIEEIKNP